MNLNYWVNGVLIYVDCCRFYAWLPRCLKIWLLCWKLILLHWWELSTVIFSHVEMRKVYQLLPGTELLNVFSPCWMMNLFICHYSMSYGFLLCCLLTWFAFTFFSYHALVVLRGRNHRIKEWLSLEGTSQVILSNNPA